MIGWKTRSAAHRQNGPPQSCRSLHAKSDGISLFDCREEEMDTFENPQGSQGPFHPPTSYAQHLSAGVGLPEWATASFSSSELAVLGAIRDAAYNAPNGACSLSVKEIARLAEVSAGAAARAITIAIAIGVVERDGRDLRNLHVYYKVG